MHRTSLAFAASRCFALAAVAIAAIGGLALPGCLDDAGDDTSATVEIPLTTSDGVDTYRLRNVHLTFTGPTNTSLDVDDDAPFAQVPLLPGDYQLGLADGWVLERAQPDGTYLAVEALLASDNPLRVHVIPNIVQGVSFEFLLASRYGSLVVSFGVRKARTLSGTAYFGASVGDGTEDPFAPYSYRSVDFALYFGAPYQPTQTGPAGPTRTIYTGAVVADFYNDTTGLLSGQVSPALSGTYSLFDLSPGTGTGQLHFGGLNLSGPGPDGNYYGLTLGAFDFPGDLAPDGFPAEPTFFSGSSPLTLSRYTASTATIPGTAYVLYFQ